MALRVAVRSIDKIAARIDKGVQNLLILFDGRAPALVLSEIHCARI
jgi:hypothetical protein